METAILKGGFHEQSLNAMRCSHWASHEDVVVWVGGWMMLQYTVHPCSGTQSAFSDDWDRFMQWTMSWRPNNSNLVAFCYPRTEMFVGCPFWSWIARQNCWLWELDTQKGVAVSHCNHWLLIHSGWSRIFCNWPCFASVSVVTEGFICLSPAITHSINHAWDRKLWKRWWFSSVCPSPEHCWLVKHAKWTPENVSSIDCITT